MRSLPAATGSGPSLLLSERSAWPAGEETTTVTLAVLLAEFVSDPALDTVAVFATEPVAVGSTRTTSVKAALAPVASEEVVQETVPRVPTGGVEQVQPAATAIERKVAFAGRGSSSVTFCATPVAGALATVSA